MAGIPWLDRRNPPRSDAGRGRSPARPRRRGGSLRAEAAGIPPGPHHRPPGWGETIYLSEIFPEARQLLYAEYYYRSEGGDVGFDPEFEPETSARPPITLHAKNAGLMLAMSEADRIVCPTGFQASRLPSLVRDRVTVVHEGIDTGAIKPAPGASITLPGGRVLDASRPVVTFVNRRFEPLRGFHIFLRALPKLLAEVPNAEVVLIGADEAGGYGLPPPKGKTWGEVFRAELGDRLDPARVHFLGRVKHETMLAALSISAAHVYFTYPFVLSWSLLEAMASACLIIGSNTAPVREVIVDGENGILLDFFDVDGLADRLIEACRAPDRFPGLRAAARQTIVDRFDRTRVCLPAWRRLVAEML